MTVQLRALTHLRERPEHVLHRYRPNDPAAGSGDRHLGHRDRVGIGELPHGPVSRRPPWPGPDRVCGG
ncbi:MAG: hypothetical protein ACR2KP_08045 [Egibacteraceae bacterium]